MSGNHFTREKFLALEGVGKNPITIFLAYILGIQKAFIPVSVMNELYYTDLLREIRWLAILRSEALRSLKEDAALQFVDAIKEKLESHGIVIHDLYDVETEFEKRLPEALSWIDEPIRSSVDSMCRFAANGDLDPVENAKRQYRDYCTSMPYGRYINLAFESMSSDERKMNVIKDDARLMMILNRDERRHDTAEDLNSFVNANRARVLVDCENLDPLKFSTVLKAIDHLDVVFVDSEHENATAWDVLAETIESDDDAKFEYLRVKRLLENKSLVDQTLAAKASEAYWRDGVRGFVIASSDSDMWSIVNVLPDAKFYFVFQRSNTSEQLELAAFNAGYSHLAIDNEYDEDLLRRAVRIDFVEQLNKTNNVVGSVEHALASLFVEKSDELVNRLVDDLFPLINLKKDFESKSISFGLSTDPVPDIAPVNEVDVDENNDDENDTTVESKETMVESIVDEENDEVEDIDDVEYDDADDTYVYEDPGVSAAAAERAARIKKAAKKAAKKHPKPKTKKKKKR